MTSPSVSVEPLSRRQLRSKLMTVRLRLAREPEHPNGSDHYGYAFVAPLDSRGMLSLSLWRKERARCRVVRFWAGENALFGLLKHRAGGRGGAIWMFDFDPDRSDDDEIGHRLDIHRFRTGEYVTLEHRGEPHVFRVSSVEEFVPEDRLAPLATRCPTTARLKTSAA
ncbi:hypothetical protein [Hansschlegelia zhihuaiae]|uniref:hypothetical protein n=1 Tax=Hansschlegelia zhihuaiae TaxID=405005 RepID=UPI0019D4A4B5|nr:hypothetical protein [Hansschlegelia zhihuaiae]